MSRQLKNPLLVTGAAGFIGFHLSQGLLKQGFNVVGLDNLNDYYDVALKKARLGILQQQPNLTFYHLDLGDRQGIEALFQQYTFDTVVNLAAQPGVRYSLINPHAYIDSNITGFTNILEGCRHGKVNHLVFASSSSVYGANSKIPFSVHDNVDHPLSLYAATKKANELMAHTYSHLYKISCTGLRFFTVYGPWGRPDMAYFIFTKKILAGEPIDVFNQGNMRRDFTYIDDVVDGIIRAVKHIPTGAKNWSGDRRDPSSSQAPYKIYNIGNNQPVNLITFIEILEAKLGIKAKLNLLPMQPGDVPINYADIDQSQADLGFAPTTSIEVGIEQFVDWYRHYY
jgi:UDP-glucuronate 4-epimerase